MRQPTFYNLADPQYEGIEERLEAEAIADEEKYERRKDEND